MDLASGKKHQSTLPKKEFFGLARPQDFKSILIAWGKLLLISAAISIGFLLLARHIQNIEIGITHPKNVSGYQWGAWGGFGSSKYLGDDNWGIRGIVGYCLSLGIAAFGILLLLFSLLFWWPIVLWQRAIAKRPVLTLSQENLSYRSNSKLCIIPWRDILSIRTIQIQGKEFLFLNINHFRDHNSKINTPYYAKKFLKQDEIALNLDSIDLTAQELTSEIEIYSHTGFTLN